MMRCVLTSLVLLLVSLNPSAAGNASSEQVKQWLYVMIDAARTHSYEGVFVYVQGQKIEAMKIVNVVGEQDKWQQMSSLNGSLRKVVVADDKIMCWLPDQQIALNSAAYSRSPLPISLPSDLTSLETNYHFESLGEDRTAGLDTSIVAIRPRDDLRYGYHLWLEHDTRLVLRSALLDEQENIIEQLMFTEFALKTPQQLAQLRPSITPEKWLDVKLQHPPVGEVVTRSEWELADVPPGFRQVMHSRYPSKTAARPTEHIVLTDGLATVSVFLDALDEQQAPLQGPTRMGAMSAFGRVTEDYQVMVVGEVPPITVKRIALGLRHQARTDTQQ